MVKLNQNKYRPNNQKYINGNRSGNEHIVVQKAVDRMRGTIKRIIIFNLTNEKEKWGLKMNE